MGFAMGGFTVAEGVFDGVGFGWQRWFVHGGGGCVVAVVAEVGSSCVAWFDGGSDDGVLAWFELML